MRKQDPDPRGVLGVILQYISTPPLRFLLTIALRLLIVSVFIWLMRWACAGVGDKQLLMLEPEDYRAWRDRTRNMVRWLRVVFTVAPILLRLCETLGDVLDTAIRAPM